METGFIILGITISIHALHEESDFFAPHLADAVDEISIHALHEESDPDATTPAAVEIFQSTLSMRRATENFAAHYISLQISIHALHEESDAPFR